MPDPTPTPITPANIDSPVGRPTGTAYKDYIALYPGLAPQINSLHMDTAQDYRDAAYRKRHPNRPLRVVNP